MMQSYSLIKRLTVKTIKEIVPGFKVFSFEERIDYRAGQYLTFTHGKGNNEIRRSYSITSSPAWNEPLSIGVKRIENGLFSRKLVDEIKPGDTLYTTGSGGFFTLPENLSTYEQLFFFAAGSGITPIYSLIKEVLAMQVPTKLVLIYSNASKEKTVFYEELNDWQKRFPQRLHIEYLFSNDRDLFRARLHKELIQRLLHSFSANASADNLYYMCGPETYIRMCAFALIENHIPVEQIKKEDFAIVPKRISAAAIPDKETHRVRLHTKTGDFSLEVSYPDSILQAAKKRNIQLPYSCETGRCGSCAATCISGKIWHSYNEVLTEKELAQGLVLTCVGHPVDGDAEIVL